MRKVWLALVGVFLMLGLTACPRFTGGGWIWSEEGPPKKATFGFQIRCDEEEGGSGQLQWNDHGSRTAFHAVITHAESEFWEWITGELCFDGIWDADDWGGIYFGHYTPVPKRLGDGGIVEVYVTDLGEPGPDSFDIIQVKLIGGVHHGYFNIGSLQGGQITMH